MKIGCGTVLFREFELERSLAAIRDIGFEYFETQAVGPWCPHVNVNHDDPENLVRLQKKYGFKGITGLWTLDGNIISNENSIASGIRSIEWAAAAGIPVVHTGDGHKPAHMSDEEAWKVFTERMMILLEVAKKNNVKLAIEPHGSFSLTLAGLQEMMKLGTPDVLGINYDACNIHRAGYVESGNNKSGWDGNDTSENEVTVLKGIADRVIHFHAKDMSDITKQCVALGAGDIKVKECIEHMKKIGYEGVVSLETEGGGDFESIVKLADTSYKYLKKLIG